jgi:hypothetical protein
MPKMRQANRPHGQRRIKMSEIQKAFDAWKEIIDPDGEERRFVRLNRDLSTQALCFHGGYTSCQSRIREKIAELEARVKDEMISSKYGTSAIDVLRELLGEI